MRAKDNKTRREILGVRTIVFLLGSCCVAHLDFQYFYGANGIVLEVMTE